ncbi:MAG: hypothetical protein JO127_03595 [Caulobacteraceae bacterium]|nr:hypothetical protein [Caulobacteraceae bacterium]
MALESARREVVLELALTHEHIREARSALAEGAYREKVQAAGELALLRRQLAMLQSRLAEIDLGEATHRTRFGWFRQVWFNLRLHFEDWIAHA